MFLRYVLTALSALLPVRVVFAANSFPEVSAFIGNITIFIGTKMVPVVFALALLVFLWGVFKYFIAGGADEGKREQGRSLMLYAIIGFVLMVSIWGIVTLITQSLGLDSAENLQNIPKIPGI